jgi:hypothetical protein
MNGTMSFEANQEEPVRTSTTSGGDAHEGIVRVMAAADRRSWSLLRGRFFARATQNRKRPVEAAGAVDAKNAPTAPRKTAQNAVSCVQRKAGAFSGKSVPPGQQPEAL